jgi:hypothetical protein
MATITGVQCRMARALLGMSKQGLATQSNIGLSTVHAIEATDTFPKCRAENIKAVHDFFINSGRVEFIGVDAVRLIS